MIELLHTGPGFDAPWTASDDQYVIGGSPSERYLELGAFAGGTFGLWEMTPGSTKGAGSSEVFAATGGAARLVHGDRAVFEATRGTVAQSLTGEDTEFHVSSTLSKFYFMAEEDALASAEARSGDLGADAGQLGVVAMADYGTWRVGEGVHHLPAQEAVIFVLEGSGTVAIENEDNGSEDNEVVAIAPDSALRVNGHEPTRWVVRTPVVALRFTLSNDA